MILFETPGKNIKTCTDYRKLNEITQIQNYSILNIEHHQKETVEPAETISLIDLTKNYLQINLTPKV